MKKITTVMSAAALSAATLFLLVAFTPTTPIITPTGAFAGGGNTGLYMTKDDFMQNRLTYNQECKAGNNNLSLHRLFGSSSFDLMVDGQKHSFAKKEVYGFRDCDARSYRFYANNAYRILDTAGFFLYQYDKLVQGAKIARPQTLVYFSVKAGDPVQELTLSNLEKAFSGNTRFRYLLNGQFRNDKELSAYDNALNTYKIKYLYTQALK